MDTYLIFVQPVDEITGQLVGAMPVPPCFTPTDTFLGIVEGMGYKVALQSADDVERVWGRPPNKRHYYAAKLLLDEVRYAQSTLN